MSTRNESRQWNGQRHFRIHGMDCAEEVAILKRELGPIVGGEENLSFDILQGQLSLSPTATDVDSREIITAVQATGMRAEPWQESSGREEPKSFWRRWGRSILTVASGLFILGAVVLHAWLAGSIRAAFGAHAAEIPLVVRSLYGLAIAAGVWTVVPKAFFAARRLRPDMNLLMMVAVAGAILIGEWFEAATVAFLFSLSLLLESWSVGRARRAVEALMSIAPIVVRVRSNDGSESVVAAESVAIGATFIVKPGERIPLDGTVTQGNSHVNQAPITGESEPVSKAPANEVFAGTINGDGALIVRSTKPAGETTLAQIIKLVGQAQSRKAPSEQWVEKFARVYTPAVMIVALAIFFLGPIVAGGTWDFWFYNALVLLVIACPCALVISTPVSIVASLAASAKQGVLVKGGVFLEIPARLRAIAFDKTGTLTEGQPSVQEIVPLGEHSTTEVLERAMALELRSEHPLATAIVAYARQHGVNARPADNFRVIKGKGAEGEINGRKFWLGSHRYLEELGQETPDTHAKLEALAARGRSIVVLGNEEHVCGLLALADAIRPGAEATLSRLRELGVQHLVMLTGDNHATASHIAGQLALTEFKAELLPDDKITAIEDLVSKYEAVAMIGDGVNDAPALARATLGIAMGAAGTDAAIETADIALMTDDLSKLPWLIQHSRRTLAIIRQNIGFSLAVKAIFVALTFAGMASLWAAIAADMGASLLVIFNGLRLLKGSSPGDSQSGFLKPRECSDRLPLMGGLQGGCGGDNETCCP